MDGSAQRAVHQLQFSPQAAGGSNQANQVFIKGNSIMCECFKAVIQK